MEFIIFSSDARGLHRRVVSGTGERAKVAVNDLSDFVESPASALDLKLRPDLQLWLLLLHVHQVPLVLQSSLTSFPELQEQSNCQARERCQASHGKLSQNYRSPENTIFRRLFTSSFKKKKMLVSFMLKLTHC